MITNKNICLVHTKNERKTKSVYDDYRKNKDGGYMEIRCPQSGELICVYFKNKKERMIWMEIKREIMEELKMVS